MYKNEIFKLIKSCAINATAVSKYDCNARRRRNQQRKRKQIDLFTNFCLN